MPHNPLRGKLSAMAFASHTGYASGRRELDKPISADGSRSLCKGKLTESTWDEARKARFPRPVRFTAL